MAVWIALLLCVAGLGGLVAGGEILRRQGVSTATTRRLVHGGVCLFVAATPWVFLGPGPVCGLAVLFVFLNGLGRGRGWWPGIHAARPGSWGTVAVPLAVLPAAAATWGVGADRVLSFQVAFLVLGLADPWAAAVGARHGRRRLTTTATLAGTGTFALIAGLLVAGSLTLADWDLLEVAVGSVVTSLVAAAVEAIGENGWDNLFVVGAVILVLEPLRASVVSTFGLVAGLGIGIIVGFGAAATGALTRRGAVGGGLFAMSLVGLGGIAWAGPGFAFFVLSSGLSFLPEESPDSQASTPRRTLRQVLANGGVAWVCLAVAVVAPATASAVHDGVYLGFLGALAAAAADTWATELGTRYGGPPWSLREGRRVASGTSGAVSLVGTAGAVLGAASIVGAAALCGPVETVSIPDLLFALGAGLMGMGADSVLGATVQARYGDSGAAELRETPRFDGEAPAQGWRWVDNDTVNFLGTATGAVAAVVLFWGA
jgi:uncharacterized membrane protein